MQDWLEGGVAELLHRQPGVDSANQLRALLGDVRAARGAGGGELDNGLLKLLWDLLQVRGGGACVLAGRCVCVLGGAVWEERLAMNWSSCRGNGYRY